MSFLALLLVALVSGQATAKPYFFWADPAVSQQVQQAAQQEAAQQVKAMQDSSSPSAELPQRLQGHFNQLVAHGNSAVKSIVETVQPDLRNIGKDLSDVMYATRENVGKRIEPTLSSATKSMAPLIEHAREDIPKALNKVSEQVKGVWEKMTNAGGQMVQANQPGYVASPNGGQLMQTIGDQLQHAAQQVVHSVQQQANTNKSS